MQVQAVLQTAKRLREADLWKEEKQSIFTRRSSSDEEHVVLFFPSLFYHFISRVKCLTSVLEDLHPGTLSVMTDWLTEEFHQTCSLHSFRSDFIFHMSENLNDDKQICVQWKNS